jgi:ACS family tartrate transporter-like MFS transporter
VGSAAVNSMSQVGAFVGPYIWGATKDATGSYSAGLQSLPVVTLVAAALIYVLYRRVRGARPVIGKISAMRITP